MAKVRFIGGVGVSAATCPVMPGAGIVKNLDDLEKLLKNDDIEIIEVGSITMLKRLGNPNNVWHYDAQGRFTVNSVGMNNLGAEAYKTVLPEMVKRAHARGKKLIVNIAAINSADEYIELMKLCIEAGVDGVVLNFGCPNIWMNGKQHQPLSFDPAAMDTLFSKMEREFYGTEQFPIPVWVKLSPLIEEPTLVRTVGVDNSSKPKLRLDEKLCREVAKVIQKYKFMIKAVVCVNTVGHARPVNAEGQPTLGPNENNPYLTGGLAGNWIHEIALTQAKLFHELLGEGIDIIGAGGVTSGQAAYDFIKVGCKIAQVTSEYKEKEDPGIFSDYADKFYIAAQAATGQI